MVVEQAIEQILRDDAVVSALVGTRIYASRMDQSSLYPAVVYRTVSADREPTLDSPATGTPETRFVIYGVAKGIVGGLSPRRQASDVEKAVRRALHGYQNTVVVTSLSPQESMEIQGIFFETSADTYDDTTQTYQYASVFSVRYSEDAP